MNTSEEDRPGGDCSATRAGTIGDCERSEPGFSRQLGDPVIRARAEAWARARVDVRSVCQYFGSYLPAESRLVFDLTSADPDVQDEAREAAEAAGGSWEYWRRRGWVGNPGAVSADGRSWYFDNRTLGVTDAAAFLLGVDSRDEALAWLVRRFGSSAGRGLFGMDAKGDELCGFAPWDSDSPADWPCPSASLVPSGAVCRGKLEPVCVRDFLALILPPADPIILACWDCGCKGVLVGDSKAKKSWLVMQLAVMLASGRASFLGWTLPKARRVLLVQSEIPVGHFQSRLRAMIAGVGLQADALGDRLHLLNLRGIGFDEETWGELERAALKVRAEVVILDPFYKFFDGDENLAKDVRPVLRRLDALCEATGAGMLTVAHTAKGFSGDRKAIDRSAGSGILARDFDAGIYLGEHATSGGALVIETVVRAYPPREAFSIRFDNEARIFRLADDLAPVIRTSRTRTARVPDDAATRSALLGIVGAGPVSVRQFDRLALAKLGIGEKRLRDLRAGALEDGALALSRREPREYGRRFIGRPDQIKALEASWASPGLGGLGV